ncbi:LacI family DNA-binding transcriptional regulator [Allostreptomyces psammosilenae]|uniref:LacI family transcriptional regulator n=1 Tax=Allostreptomyces psammosilenae TaxID=1892865 RepID=A0A853A1T0_9ACTN|nr:LacI family DNA-binding transcriptional regulator [Allostreptomyces psammosilenae]NYI04741.1 LacI family transcriptional regulator [Allostreptomyces psammosilenae]
MAASSESAPGGGRRGSRRVTIIDVGRAAGVSRQTVSRALNDMPEIDPDTKRRVLQAAKELGYRPSRFARNLVRREAQALGLVVPNLKNPYFTEIADAIIEAARRAGWQVVLMPLDAWGEPELDALATLARQVDVLACYFGGPEERLLAAAGGVPVVLLEREPVTADVPWVGVDVDAGVDAGLAHLAERGHRDIGMIDCEFRPVAAGPADAGAGDAGGAPDAHAGRSARARRLLAVAASFGLRVTDERIRSAPETIAGGAAATEELLTAAPEVTAVLTFNDYMAIGALMALHGRGLSVPGDCAVVGFDGLVLGSAVEPPLTSLSIDKGRFADLVMERVRGLLDGTPVTGRSVLTPTVVVRRST